MGRSEFRTVVKALITYQGKVLIGQKEEGDKPHSGEWHFLGGHIEESDEQIEEAVRREVKEETDLDVEVHQIVDAMMFSWNKDGELDALQVLYHCEASSDDAKPKDDLQDVRWVKPEDLEEELWEEEVDRIENREKRKKFIEKLEKMPAI